VLFGGLFALIYVCIYVCMLYTYGLRKNRSSSGHNPINGRPQINHPNLSVVAKMQNYVCLSIFSDVFGLIFSYFLVVCFCFNLSVDFFSKTLVLLKQHFLK